MLRRRAAALLPLGACRGPEALNVWEHIAFAEWLETHELLEDEARAMRDAWLFEAEASFYESLVYETASDVSDFSYMDGGLGAEDE